MKKELIAGIVASLFIGQAPIADATMNDTNTIVEETNAKAKTASLIEFKTFKDLSEEVIEEHEAKLEAERLRLEAEERARQEEEARKAEELRLELERQASVGFNDMDVTRLSNMKAYELENVLYSVTSWSGMAPYASYFIEAEEMYGVNALFICAIAAHESGWGKYPAGDGTNLTGYAVYSSTSSGTTFEGGVRHNILETARLIAEDYVNPNGIYHTEWTGYNYGKSIYEINSKYCLKEDRKTTDMGWSESIGKIAKNLSSKYHELRN